MTNPVRVLSFVFMLAASAAFGWRPLVNTLMLALTSEAYTHILLILPLSCALIYLTRGVISSLPGRAGPASWALLAVALLLAGFDRFGSSGWSEDLRTCVSMLAIVTWWIGCIVFHFGMPTFQALLFPLCFLFWLVPIPAFALDEIIYFLQQYSALAAKCLFVIVGVPVTQDGTLLSIRGLDIEVAPQCSSIRSSLMLMITTMVLAHLFLRSGWRKGLLIATAVPLAAVKNGLRIFTIVELGTRVDPGIFDSNLHHRGGILFFAISVAMTVGLLWVLRRTESVEPHVLEAAR